MLAPSVCHRAHVVLRAPRRGDALTVRCEVCGLQHPQAEVEAYELREVRKEALDTQWREVELSEGLEER